MTTTGRAVHHTILVADMADFGDPQRSSKNQLAMRAGLYQALETAFRRSAIPWDACYREDRGDGLFTLAPADVPKCLFVEDLPTALVATLHDHNRAHRPHEQIRLRLALHAGEVAYDRHGVAATALILAFRMVNAKPCRTALTQSPNNLAIITSHWFYQEVVRNTPAVDDQYQQVRITLKETRTTGWVCTPNPPRILTRSTFRTLPSTPHEVA
jgi:hypothetical protein